MAGGYIEILSADDTFEFKPAENTVLNLRIIDDDTEKRFRKECTRKNWERHTRVEDFDSHEFIAKCIDYGIVSWKGVRRKGVEQDCTRENKLLLPEWLKLEVQKACLGKQGGAMAAEEAAEEKKG